MIKTIEKYGWKLLFRKCGGNGAGVAMLAILSITRAASPSWSQPSEKKKIQNQFRFFYFGVFLPISLRLGSRGSMNMGIVSNGKLGQLVSNTKKTHYRLR